MILRFGALVDPLSEQLEANGASLPDRLVGQYQRDADAITRLKIRGLINDSQTAKLIDRLSKRIIRSVEELGQQEVLRG